MRLNQNGTGGTETTPLTSAADCLFRPSHTTAAEVASKFHEPLQVKVSHGSRVGRVQRYASCRLRRLTDAALEVMERRTPHTLCLDSENSYRFLHPGQAPWTRWQEFECIIPSRSQNVRTSWYSVQPMIPFPRSNESKLASSV